MFLNGIVTDARMMMICSAPERWDMGVILNCLIFPQMSVRLVQEKTIVLGVIEEGQVASYAIRVCHLVSGFVYFYAD